jgi:glucosamine-6-phosphate deaminase
VHGVLAGRGGDLRDGDAGGAAGRCIARRAGPGAADVGRVVADAIALVLCRGAVPVLGLATGSSPVPVYDELAARYSAGVLSFASARAFLLDEYVGLPVGHPQSYASYISTVFTSRVDFAPRAVQGPDGSADDLVAAAVWYEAALAGAGGVDLQLLGIGADGHIGFNEPGSSLASRTRLKTLTQQTRLDNARFFSSLDEVPRHVITQGVGTILEARHLVLVAWGAAKAAAVAAAVEGPVTAMVPASALQLHPHVSVVIDSAAASKLRLADYYRETYAHKPRWQGL